jgi:glycolate oxidase FAD binding subunit
MDAILQQWQQRVIAATADKQALCLRGGGTKDWYGESPQGAIFDTRPYAGIIAYDASELVITVRCGTPLAELEAVLAKQGQMLGFEPPHFGPQATVGGMVAAGLAGPGRASAGCVRDFLLGLQLLDGRGEVLNFGGQVMKNVAGYDVSRVMAGALGMLGVILQVSLKVLPRPVAETTLCFEMGEYQALQCMNQWVGRALPISATAWCDGVLHLRLAGALAAVREAQQQLGGEVVAAAAAVAFWRTMREQEAAFFMLAAASNRHCLWRLSMPSAAPVLIMPGAQLLEWGGAQRWLVTDAVNQDEATRIRQVAAASGGHATLFRTLDKSTVPVFHPLTGAVAQIQTRLKAAFDPAGIFNPGRMAWQLS